MKSEGDMKRLIFPSTGMSTCQHSRPPKIMVSQLTFCGAGWRAPRKKNGGWGSGGRKRPLHFGNEELSPGFEKKKH